MDSHANGLYEVVVVRRSNDSEMFQARTRAEWHTWLADHHQSASSVWLVFHKRGTGKSSITYSDALDEALCFGWIDSLLKRIDDERYARKFKPRKPGSSWSTINRKRWAELKASGRLMPAGLKRAPTHRSGDAPRRSPSGAPPYIEEALRRHPAAHKYFESLAPSYRRMYIGWVDSAKREETKARRLGEAIALLAAGKKLGLK